MILYSIGCPQCKVLEAKMKQKNMKYDIVTDVDLMTKKGFKSVPVLELDDGTILHFKDAIQYVREENK